MKNISGIYKIENTINGKVYFGSSNNINKRKKQHFSSLKNGSHCNTHLQRSFNIYGEDNFIFEAVEFCEEKNLLNIEQMYLDIYFDGSNRCYNENPIANKPPSRKGIQPWNKGKNNIYSEETLRKMSMAKKGRCCSEEQKQKLREKSKYMIFQTSKKVLCVEINTVFKSINEASRQMNIERRNISKCLNKQRKTAGGYHWSFV